MYPVIAYVPILVSFMQLYIIRSSGNIEIRKGWLRVYYMPLSHCMVFFLFGDNLICYR
jgi:hypothetical protein